MKRDLTGERFGKLTVIGPAEKEGSKRSYWRCKCDCGNETLAEYSSLINGHTKSCGCARGRKSEDISGMRFGRLVAIRPAPDEIQISKQMWECQCDCGNICLRTKRNLKSGKTKSCGCLRKDRRREEIKTSIHVVDGTCIEKISSKTMFSNNTTGARGVYRNSTGKWRAAIGFQGKVYYLGTYSDYDDAVAARKKAEETLYTPFLEQYKKGQNRTEENIPTS